MVLVPVGKGPIRLVGTSKTFDGTGTSKALEG